MIDTVAVLFGGTDAVRELTLTGSLVDVGAMVGFDVGLAVDFGVVSGFLVGSATLAAVGDAATSVGPGVASNGLAPWPTNPNPKPKPKAAGGAVGDGPVVVPPIEDPTAAARITTAIRMPIHVLGFQPELVGETEATAGVDGSGDTAVGLESEV